MRTFISRKLFFVAVLLLFNCVAIHAADDLITQQITITLDEAGTLPSKISEAQKYLYTNLKIVGDINGTDLRLIRDMAGSDENRQSTDGKLATLDLSDAKFVEGGGVLL